MTWDLLLRVADVASSLITIVGGALVTWAVVRLKMRRLRMQRQIGETTSGRLAAVAIAFQSGDVEPTVRGYLTDTYPANRFQRVDYQPGSQILVDGADTVPIVIYHHSDTLAQVDLERHVQAIQALQRALDEAGYKEILLFQRGTVAFATLVGTLFANWGNVHVHHFNAGSYENWMPLNAIKFRDRIPSAPLDQIAEAVLHVVDSGDGSRDRGGAETASVP